VRALAYPGFIFISSSLFSEGQPTISFILHEIIQTWTGNLVTPVDWSNYWLNTGISTYICNKIISDFYGAGTGGFTASEGYKALLSDFDKFGETDSLTSLQPDINRVSIYVNLRLI
jgi:leukotriene-A4 hydrolase